MPGCGPIAVLLEGYDDPDGEVDEPESNNIEDSSPENAVFDPVDKIDYPLRLVLPLEVEHPHPDTHHIGRHSDIRFVVELIHELGLRWEFRVGNRVSPVVSKDHHKRCDAGPQPDQESEKEPDGFVFVVDEEDQRGDQEELEVHCEVPSPSEAVVNPRRAVVSKVINEEHVPDDASVVAGGGKCVEAGPDRP